MLSLLGLTTRRAIAWLVVIAVLVTGCSSPPEVPSDVAAVLDQPGEFIADMTAGLGEDVPLADLLASIDRAGAAGTELRVVVVNEDDSFVTAESVTERYGGTALTYRSNDTSFQTSSVDMKRAQMDRATNAAAAQADIGESVGAFVDVVAGEGLEAQGRSIWRTLALIGLILGALFALWQLLRLLRARRALARRRAAFQQRRALLADWATRLVPEVNAVAAEHDKLDQAGIDRLRETYDFVSSVPQDIERARNLGDLDAAEIRLARNAIKLRELRQFLGH